MKKTNTKSAIIPFKAPADFKALLKQAAALHGQNSSEYLRERMEPIVRRDIAAKRREYLAEAA